MNVDIDGYTFSVSEFSDIISTIFEHKEFSNISIIGEIYSLKIGPKFSYIDLGDENFDQTNSPIVKCAFNMFKIHGCNLNDFSKGDIVKIKGTLSYYPHGCSLTIWCSSIETILNQLGKNWIKKRKLLEKLNKLGYLDPLRKKTIPKYVNRVGIVTAINSAAYNDILVSLKSQFPTNTILYPAIVQGENAALSIIKAIKKAIVDNVDVIIIGRGGGSNSDLSCFDDEELAMSIVNSPIPIITCIGHSIDEAVADKVADKVCITPTEAGKSINPSLEDVYYNIEQYKQNLNSIIEKKIHNFLLQIQHYNNLLESLSIFTRLKLSKELIEKYKMNLASIVKNKLDGVKFSLQNKYLNINNAILLDIKKNKKNIENFKIILEQYNIENITNNGYIKLLKNNKKISSAKDVKRGDEVTLSFIDGMKKALIK